MKPNKKRTIEYSNAVKVRKHNISVTVVNLETRKGFGIIFRNANKDDINDKPACTHKIIRGKVMETTICLSEEGMHSLIEAYLTLRNKNLDDIILKSK